MKRTPSNAAIAILLSGATFVLPASSAFAQDASKLAQDASKPTPGANLQYTGADTRLGIGIDSDNHARGELFQVLRGDDKSATLGEIWGSRNAGGAKLSQHWASGTTAVNKVFAAVDQGDKNLRKVTVGGGQERETWFWNTYLSKGVSGARLGSVSSVATTATQSGVDAGRPYVEDVTTTVTNKAFTRPYDYGVGARVGHFYEPVLARVTAGLDYEWGKFSSRQWTGTLTAEKFFANSPISVAISGELFRRSGDFEGRRNDQRGMLTLRYELGAPRSSFKANKITRMVTTTERVPDPNWRAPAAPAPVAAVAAPAAKPAEPTTRIEKRIMRSNANDAQETYFDLSSSTLKPAAFKELDALVGRIAAQRPYVDLRVNIVGHTCPTGGDRNNVALSAKRAEAVKAYLVSKGVPSELVTSRGEAGRSPKYPEVKGQSFRNRRADTEVLIVKERVEEVQVSVPAVAAAPVAPPVVVAPVAPPAVAPMIDRQVQREVVEAVPNNWIARALHNPAQHKSAVDTYRWVETDTAKSTGARRYINRPPTAVGDAYTIECSAPVTFNVLANDTDADGDALTITSASTPGKGTVAIVAGRIVYTPAASTCTGTTDSFTYAVSDGKGGVATATVAVTIKAAPVVIAPPPPAPPVNTAPVAVNDVFVVPCKTSAVLDVLGNDSDKDGDALTITSITQPSKAGIAIGPNGKTLIYNPTGACFVSDTFTYTISDGKGGSATATVTLIDP